MNCYSGSDPENIPYIQSEMHWPIPWNSVESDLGCTSRIYFDNVRLSLHNVTLTSPKSCQHANTIASVIAAKQTVIIEVYVFSVKYCYIEKYINFIYSAD